MAPLVHLHNNVLQFHSGATQDHPPRATSFANFPITPTGSSGRREAPLTSIVSSSSSTVPEIGWRGGHWTRKLCRLIFGGGGWEMEMIPICMPSPIGKLHCRPLNEQPASQLGSHYHPNTEQGSPTSGHKYSSWPSVVDGRQTQTVGTIPLIEFLLSSSSNPMMVLEPAGETNLESFFDYPPTSSSDSFDVQFISPMKWVIRVPCLLLGPFYYVHLQLSVSMANWPSARVSRYQTFHRKDKLSNRSIQGVRRWTDWRQIHCLHYSNLVSVLLLYIHRPSPSIHSLPDGPLFPFTTS